jgi:hypothetical protein
MRDRLMRRSAIQASAMLTLAASLTLALAVPAEAVSRASAVPISATTTDLAPPSSPPARQETPQTAPAAQSAEDVVRTLYKMVSFDAGKNVDWEHVKALFIPEAVIVLRASRTSMNVLNRNTFVDDFLKFISDAKLEDQAFEETIVAIKTQETGEVARATVHYAARIPSRDRPAQHGIDVFLLMKVDGRWRIVSIVNEIVRPGVDVPEEIRK